MKKHLIPLLMMAVLSVGLLYGSAVVISSAENCVVVTETILQGDRSVIDGLTVQVRLDESGFRTNDTWFMISHAFGTTDTVSVAYGAEPFSLDYSGADDAEEPVLSHDENAGLESLHAVSYLNYDLESDRMYARGIKDGQYTLLILRESTRELLGEFQIPVNCALRSGDGYLLVLQTDVIRILEEKNGVYQEAYSAPYDGSIENSADPLARGIDYKDGKLAIVRRTKYETGQDYQISVYTSEGLQFEAQYLTSVHRPNGWSIHFSEHTPVAAAEWEDAV